MCNICIIYFLINNLIKYRIYNYYLTNIYKNMEMHILERI